MSLLPPNATPLEQRIAASASPAPAGLVPTLWDPATCPAHLLHVLAWAESVDDWDPTWPEGVQRAVIAASRAVHRRKGTPAAIKQALAARGQPDAVVLERFDNWQYDGSSAYNGVRQHGGSLNWAVYKILLKRPITLDQAAALQLAISQVTRNCCHLIGIDYSQAALRHNGAGRYDGSYTHGLINL